MSLLDTSDFTAGLPFQMLQESVFAFVMFAPIATRVPSPSIQPSLIVAFTPKNEYSPTTHRPDKTTCEAADAQTPKPNEVETLVVTGTRSGQSQRLDQIGGSVTVLSPELLERRQLRDVSDILRDVPGVAVSRVPGQTQVRLRGTEGNHTLVLIDGIEVSDPFAGEFDFSSLIADDGARVEVLR
eukprot:gene58044-79507_t